MMRVVQVASPRPHHLRHLLSRRPPPNVAIHHQRRHFVNLPPNPFTTTPDPQTLTATRTLPYPPAAIYSIIADVPSYSSFLPFCKSSTVTRWSAPDALTGKRWPDEAKLVVGWQHVEETFYSRIYCVPGRIVEAVGGASKSRLHGEEVGHHLSEEGKDGSAQGDLGDRSADQSLITHLLTRWTVRPAATSEQLSVLTKGVKDGKTGALEKAGGQTEVTLAIEFQFASPLYATMSAAAMPLVAGKIIEAFEKRVVHILDRPQETQEGEGVRNYKSQ